MIENAKEKCFEKVKISYEILRLQSELNLIVSDTTVKPLESIDFEKIKSLLDGTTTNRDESFVELLKFCINYKPKKIITETKIGKTVRRFDKWDEDFAKHCMLSLSVEEYFLFYVLSIEPGIADFENLFIRVIRNCLSNYNTGELESHFANLMISKENESLKLKYLFGSLETELSPLIKYGCEDFLKKMIEQRNQKLKS